MRRDFVNEVSRIQRIKRTDLIEKDLILHQMLLDLSKNKFFSENFVFKGGTCLIKCYLGYFRFSEDIDFTWKHQKVFEDKSQKEVRSYLSNVIDELGDIFEGIAKKRELDFKCEKHNRNYVELGGGNKTCTLKIWYQSEILDRRSFVKVQINFVEKLYFNTTRVKLRSLLSKGRKEFDALFPEYAEYSQRISFDAYDIKEILCEKIRSILTRVGVKSRDFLDVYLICKKFSIKLEDMRYCIIGKTQFMLNLYEKYRNNLAEKKSIVTSAKAFTWGEEKGLLLQDVKEKELYKFLEGFGAFLKNIIKELV
jgi:predicted nucleotidyltransferase component of viral defense system